MKGYWLGPRPAGRCSPFIPSPSPIRPGHSLRTMRTKGTLRLTPPTLGPAWDPSARGLTGVGPGHCKALLILLPGNTQSCAESGPGFPQPQGQREQMDREGQTTARVRGCCQPSRTQIRGFLMVSSSIQLPCLPTRCPPFSHGPGLKPTRHIDGQEGLWQGWESCSGTWW